MTCLFTIKVQTPDLAWHSGQLRTETNWNPNHWDWVWGLWHSPLWIRSSGYDMAGQEHRVDFGMVRCGGPLSDFHGDWDWSPFQSAGKPEVGHE